MTTIPSGVNPGFETGVRSGLDIVAIATKVFNALYSATVAITGGTINGTSVGATTPSTGAFTTLSASGALTATNSVALSPASHNVVLSPTGSGVVTVNPATAGTLDNVALGVTTPLAVHATTLAASGVTSFSNASVSFTGLPTSDPHVVDRAWLNTGVLTVSAG